MDPLHVLLADADALGVKNWQTAVSTIRANVSYTELPRGQYEQMTSSPPSRQEMQQS